MVSGLRIPCDGCPNTAALCLQEEEGNAAEDDGSPPSDHSGEGTAQIQSKDGKEGSGDRRLE